MYVCERLCVDHYDNILVCVCLLYVCWVWPRGEARLKPTVSPMWSGGSGTFLPSLMSVKALFYDSLFLFNRNHDHEGNSRAKAAECRRGQLKDGALLQESARGEAIQENKLF